MDLGVSSICGSVVPIFIFSNVKNKKQIFKSIEISECLMEKHIYIYIYIEALPSFIPFK